MTGSPLESARARVATLQARLAARALGLRAPPPEPTTCCGRGCNGCVWEGFYAALAFWCEDAEAMLGPAMRPDAPPTAIPAPAGSLADVPHPPAAPRRRD